MSAFVLAVIIGSVFIMVVTFVIMVKLLQIAEDIRFMRSRQDSSVKPPMKYTTVLAWCLLVSAALVVLIAMTGTAVVGSLNAGSW